MGINRYTPFSYTGFSRWRQGCRERKAVAATTISCPNCDTEMMIPDFIIDEVKVCCPGCTRQFSADVSLEGKVAKLRMEAESGNAEAQHDLEYCQRHGIGVVPPADETKGLGENGGNPPNGKALQKPTVVLPKPTVVLPKPTIRLPKPTSLMPKATTQSSRPQVIKNPTEEQKDELANIVFEVLGESGIKGASFGEDGDNPFAFYISMPGEGDEGDERLVIYACNKLFHRLGLLPHDKGLMIGQLGDYCSIVSSGDGTGKCYVAALNHPVVIGLNENAPQARFILKNWRDWDGEE